MDGDARLSFAPFNDLFVRRSLHASADRCRWVFNGFRDHAGWRAKMKDFTIIILIAGRKGRRGRKNIAVRSPHSRTVLVHLDARNHAYKRDATDVFQAERRNFALPETLMEFRACASVFELGVGFKDTAFKAPPGGELANGVGIDWGPFSNSKSVQAASFETRHAIYEAPCPRALCKCRRNLRPQNTA